jgi:hypothetical protein
VIGRVVGLTLTVAVMLAASAILPSASVAREVCCFRVSADVYGYVLADYGQSDPAHGDYEEGSYAYLWQGSAYGLARYNHSVLHSERGVANGTLFELAYPKWVDEHGQPAQRGPCDPGGPATWSSSGTGPADPPLSVAEPGVPSISVGTIDGLWFGRPYIGWAPTCQPYSDVYPLLEEANSNWHSGDFFTYHHLTGISATRLGHGGSQQLLCAEHAVKNAGYVNVKGIYAVYINIVHIAASQEQRNLRRLHGMLGALPPNYINNPAIKAGTYYVNGPPPNDFASNVPENGCHAYQG